jgi:hypothetical protein
MLNSGIGLCWLVSSLTRAIELTRKRGHQLQYKAGTFAILSIRVTMSDGFSNPPVGYPRFPYHLNALIGRQIRGANMQLFLVSMQRIWPLSNPRNATPRANPLKPFAVWQCFARSWLGGSRMTEQAAIRSVKICALVANQTGKKAVHVSTQEYVVARQETRSCRRLNRDQMTDLGRENDEMKTQRKGRPSDREDPAKERPADRVHHETNQDRTESFRHNCNHAVLCYSVRKYLARRRPSLAHLSLIRRRPSCSVPLSLMYSSLSLDSLPSTYFASRDGTVYPPSSPE